MRNRATILVDVRHLGSGDTNLMHDILSVFSAAFDAPDDYDTKRPCEAYFARLLGNDSFIALAAVESGAVVGGLAAYELQKFEQQRSELYIYDLAVVETHRRRGIATALIEALQRIATDRGAWVVYVQADYGDDPAIALYSNLGVREDVLHFDIPPL